MTNEQAYELVKFQSTLSSRRATAHHPLHTQPNTKISIHALLTESDLTGSPPTTAPTDFNPRSPHGERPIPSIRTFHPSRISIHALLTESDSTATYLDLDGTISIHALLTESDLRLYRLSPLDSISIHALLTESDSFAASSWLRKSISIHALLTESDSSECFLRHPRRNFNPRSPHGERPPPQHRLPPHPAISIHALLTESDHLQQRWQHRYLLQFQSTLSSRRATANTTKLALSFLSKVPILGWEKSKKAKGSANARGSFPVYGKNKVRIPWGDFECFRFAPIK